MTKLFVQQFQAILSHGLPGERAHAELMPVNRPFSSKALKEAKNYKKSAVGVILFRKQNTIRCILIQRTHYDGAHSRQVSFPGGKMDPSDRRGKIITLNAKGLQVQKQIWAVYGPVIQQHVGDKLSEEETRQFVQLLKKLQ